MDTYLVTFHEIVVDDVAPQICEDKSAGHK